jgi:hypothetical protein
VGTIDIPELRAVLENQNKIFHEILELKSRTLPEWVTLKEACTWKGVDLKTIQNNPELKPPESARERVGHKYRWPREVILEWARKDDELLKRQGENVRLKVV